MAGYATMLRITTAAPRFLPGRASVPDSEAVPFAPAMFMLNDPGGWR